MNEVDDGAIWRETQRRPGNLGSLLRRLPAKIRERRLTHTELGYKAEGTLIDQFSPRVRFVILRFQRAAPCPKNQRAERQLRSGRATVELNGKPGCQRDRVNNRR